MTEFLFSNNAKGTLETAIGGADVILNLQTGEGALFPAVGAGSGQGFYAKVESGSTSVFMVCTQRAGDALTVTRTESNSFPAGATVKLVLNSAVLEHFMQQGVFRTVTTDPDGSLAAEYAGEEVYQSTTEHWWKHTTGTEWKIMTD